MATSSFFNFTHFSLGRLLPPVRKKKENIWQRTLWPSDITSINRFKYLNELKKSIEISADAAALTADIERADVYIKKGNSYKKINSSNKNKFEEDTQTLSADKEIQKALLPCLHQNIVLGDHTEFFNQYLQQEKVKANLAKAINIEKKNISDVTPDYQRTIITLESGKNNSILIRVITRPEKIKILSNQNPSLHELNIGVSQRLPEDTFLSFVTTFQLKKKKQSTVVQFIKQQIQAPQTCKIKGLQSILTGFKRGITQLLTTLNLFGKKKEIITKPVFFNTNPPDSFMEKILQIYVQGDNSPFSDPLRLFLWLEEIKKSLNTNDANEIEVNLEKECKNLTKDQLLHLFNSFHTNSFKEILATLDYYLGNTEQLVKKIKLGNFQNSNDNKKEEMIGGAVYDIHNFITIFIGIIEETSKSRKLNPQKIEFPQYTNPPNTEMARQVIDALNIILNKKSSSLQEKHTDIPVIPPQSSSFLQAAASL